MVVLSKREEMSLKLEKFDYKKDLKKQRNLFIECFPEIKGTSVEKINHYHWKFHSINQGEKSFEYAAYTDEDLVGYYAALPYRYIFNEEFLKIAMVCDVMTGVKARGKGVFTKLGIYSTNQLKDQGFDFSTGYPVRQEVIPGHIKAGWEIIFKLPLYGRFLRFDSFLKTKKVGYLAPFANLIMWLWTWLIALFFNYSKRSLSTRSYNSDQLLEIDGFDDFYNKWGNQTTISLVKNSEFLSWRLGAPRKKYKIVTLNENNNIVGSLIAHETEKEGVPCIGILDISILNGYEKYSHYLIKKIIKEMQANKAELLLMMMSKTMFKKYHLFMASFMKTPYTFSLIIKLLNSKIDFSAIKQEKNWHLMWIDSDDL